MSFRVTQGGLIVAHAGGEGARVTQGGLIVVSAPLVAPSKPSITSVTQITASSGFAQASDYSHPNSIGHERSRWQVATDSGFGTIILDVIDLDEPAFTKTNEYLTGLPAGTNLWVRVAYRGVGTLWSDFSNGFAWATLSAAPPAQPTLTATPLGPRDVQLTVGNIVPGGSEVHVETTYEIDESGGDYSTPVFTRTVQGVGNPELITIVATSGMSPSTAYIARAQIRQSDDDLSAWSANASFTTLAEPAQAPDQPTIVVLDVGQTTVTLQGSIYNHQFGDAFAFMEWQIALDSGFAQIYASGKTVPVADVGSPQVWSVSGLTVDTQFWVRLRYEDTPGADQSPWSTTANTFTTLANLLGNAEDVLAWVFPVGGEPLTGTVQLEVTPGSSAGVEYDVEYSPDRGLTWVPVATAAASFPVAWDVSGLATGVYDLRVKARDISSGDETAWEYTVAVVDPTGSYDADGVWQSPDLLYKYLHESSWLKEVQDIGGDLYGADPGDGDQTFWSHIADDVDNSFQGPWHGSGGYLGRNFNTSLPATPGVLARDDFLEPLSGDFFVRGSVGNGEGNFIWWRHLSAEQCSLGVAANAKKSLGVEGAPVQGWGFEAGPFTLWPFGNCYPLDGAFIRGAGPMNVKLGRIQNLEIGAGTEGIGNVHALVRACPDCGGVCAKWIFITLHLRITTVRWNPDGTRDVKVQGRVIGQSVIPPAGGGWHLETVVQGFPEECGSVGLLSSGKSAGDAWRVFTSLGALPTEFGTCEGDDIIPPLESCPPPAIDLTIFGNDDVTPILGSVDVDGEVVEASFSSEPTHPRPWIKMYDHGPEESVDPIRGGGAIGQMAVEVLDVRLDVCDPQTGQVTAILPDGVGYSQLQGRRAQVRRRVHGPGGGEWTKVLDGMIHDIQMAGSIVTLRFTLRDFRERERRVTLFPHPNWRNPDTGQLEPTAAVFPRGPTIDYGLLPDIDLVVILGSFYLEDARPPAVGQFLGPVPNAGAFLEDGVLVPGQAGLIWVGHGNDEPFQEQLNLGAPRERVEFDFGNGTLGQQWDQIAIQWRYPGDDDTQWRVQEILRAWPDFYGRNAFATDGTQFSIPFSATQSEIDAGLLPTFGSQIEFRVLSLAEPSQFVPFAHDGNAGRFLERVLNGEATDKDPMLKWNQESVDAFKDAVAVRGFRFLATESADMRDWLEKNVYAPFGFVPVWNDDWELVLADTSLPDSTESLVILDDTVIASAGWGQDGTNAITVVEFQYKIEFKKTVFDGVEVDVEESRRGFWGPGAIVSPGASAPTRLTAVFVNEAELVKVVDAAEFVGLKTERFEPETIRTVGMPNTGEVPTDTFLDNDLGVRLGLEKSNEIVDRYRYGPVLVNLVVRNVGSLRSMQPGDWVIYDVDWIPNMDTGLRGGQRLGLIIADQTNRELTRTLTLLDGGPGASTLQVPTIESLEIIDG